MALDHQLMSFDKTAGHSSVYSPNCWYYSMIHTIRKREKMNKMEHEALERNKVIKILVIKVNSFRSSDMNKENVCTSKSPRLSSILEIVIS